MTEQPRLRLVRDQADAPPLDLDQPSDEDQDEYGTELEQVVIEGEIVDEPTADVPEPDRLPTRLVGRAVATISGDDPAARAARLLAVHGVTVAAGWHSWLIRAWDAATLGVHRRQIKAAEAAGDREALAEWIERKQQATNARRDRLADLPRLALALAKVGGGCLVGTVVLLLVTSTLVWLTGAGAWTDLWVWLGDLIRWSFGAVVLAWTVLVTALPVALVVGGWREGRRRGTDMPAWVVEPDATPDGRDVIPDEGAILNALRNLGIAELNKAFKGGWRPRFVLGTGRDGKGWRTQLELPPAVTVEMINKKKRVLAHNLVRFPVEVWPTEPKPGLLDLWVADQGALTGPVDPWPLLREGSADYFKGVPVGVSIRGKTIIGRLSEANYALAGMMGSGKSTLIITALLGGLLDPLVEADVFVMAVNADYDPMKPRLRTLMTGTGDHVVEACLNTLREAYADLDRRGKALQEHGVRAVNRELAEKDARLRPRIFVVDECQALYMHEDYGEEAISLSVKLLNAARKYGYTLILATPEPSSASLPRKLMTVISNKACFAIGDQQSNDAVLGTGSYTAGISAVGLEPKTDEGPGDVGTCMAKSFEPKPGLLRCFYVSERDVPPVVERALALREKAGIGPAGQAVEERDLLEDVAAVLGEERTKLSDVAALLRKLAPHWRPYESLTGTDLRDILTREYEVRVTNSGNVLRLDPADLRSVKARRDAASEGGE